MRPHKEKIEKWKNDIELGIKYREKCGGTAAEWRRYREYYRGEFASNIVPVNLIFSFGRSLIPRIYFRNPHVVVTALKPGYEAQARIVEALDNWIIEEIGIKKQIKRMCLHAYLYGTAFGKIGYDSEYGYQPPAREEALYMEGLEQLDKKGFRLEYNANVKPGMPWFLATHPIDVVVPWGVDDLKNTPWIAHRFYRTLEDVKQDPRFKNTSNLKATYRIDDGRELGEARKDIYNEAVENDLNLVELWEIRDYKRGEVSVICFDHDKFLYGPEKDDFQIEGLNFESLVFNEDDYSVWGISDVKIIEPQQQEINELRTQMVHHRRIALRKLLVDENKLTDDEIEKMISEDIGAVVKCKGSPSEAVMPFQVSGIPQDLLLHDRQIMQDVREMLGFSRNQLGEFDASTRRTATEARIVQIASQLRTDERRDAVADLLQSVIKKINQIIFSYWSKPQIMQVVGPMGVQWVEFTGEDIRGEYNIEVSPEEALPVDSRTRRADAVQFYQMFAGNPNIDQRALARWVLRQWGSAPVNELMQAVVSPSEIISIQQFMEGIRQNASLPLSVQGVQSRV